jgi:hypothetical protein
LLSILSFSQSQSVSALFGSVQSSFSALSGIQSQSVSVEFGQLLAILLLVFETLSLVLLEILVLF